MSLRDELSTIDPEILIIDDFDAAFIGIASTASSLCVAAYDYDLLIKVLTDVGLSEEESQEYVDFNIVGAYVGERTPVIIARLMDFETASTD